MALFQYQYEGHAPATGTPMETLIFRGRPDERNECDQWTLERHQDDEQEFVVQEHVKLDALMAGKPHLRLVRRMTVPEFLKTDQPPAVQRRLRALLDTHRAVAS
jgi:hypothetical protein